MCSDFYSTGISLFNDTQYPELVSCQRLSLSAHLYFMIFPSLSDHCGEIFYKLNKSFLLLYIVHCGYIPVQTHLYTIVAVHCDQPCRELFVWAVFFSRIPLAVMLWKQCPDQLGSALVARLMCKSLASEARSAGKLHLADELDANVRFVIIFCFSVIRDLYAQLNGLLCQ